MVRINRDLKPRLSDEDEAFASAGGEDGPADPKPAPLPPDEDDDDFNYFEDDDDQPRSPVAASDDDEEETVAEEPVAKPKLPKGAAPPAKAAKMPAQTARRVVQLGTKRKLTKKATAQLSEWRGKNHGKKVASLVAGHIDSAKKKFPRGVFHGSETKDLVVGIPIPSLAFEFLLAQDVFPLGLVIQLVAKHGCGKSGLGAEFARWFELAGGFTTLNENETKFSPEWYESIMGKESFERVQLNRCDSVESWQKHMTFDIASYKKLMEGTKEAPGPGRTIPWLQIVDSVMGKMSIDSQEAISKEGSAGRGFPIEALKITRYMRSVPQWIDGWPFAIVLVNHLKLKKNDEGREEREKAGGALISFQESFELEMRKSGLKKIETAEYEGFQVDIECAKNSFGPTHRSIRSRVLWWDEPDPVTGDYCQKTVWDWDWSTIHLLFSIIKGGDRNVLLRNRLKDAGFHMDFNSPTAESASAWSKTLGISKNNPLPWDEVGAMIARDAGLTAMLRRALMIKNRPLLQGDYLEQMDGLAQEMP